MDKFSKTHWAAAAMVVAQALEAGGIIPTGMVSAVNTLLSGVLALTVGHRVVKVATGTQPQA